MTENGTSRQWWKSSRSGTSGCLEFHRSPEKVFIRDSKDRTGPVLEFDPEAWAAFIDAVKRGEFDRAPHPG